MQIQNVSGNWQLFLIVMCFSAKLRAVEQNAGCGIRPCVPIMAYPARENHEIMCQWNSLSILLALKLPLRLAGVKLSLNQVWNPRMIY